MDSALQDQGQILDWRMEFSPPLTGWSSPTWIADDTRVELSPKAVPLGDGSVLAVWTRIRDEAFATPILTSADLPIFYRRLEVVSSRFDALTRTWGPITALTNDDSMDTDVNLTTDGSGQILASWLANQEGEFLGSAEAPSKLMVAYWDSTAGNWTLPQLVGDGLVGVSAHAAAMYPGKATLVLARDPDLSVSGDSEILRFDWDGLAWTGPTVFASGGGENLNPRVLFDSQGEGHAIWRRGEDLVAASLSNPQPQVIRQGSESGAFFGARLFRNASNNLTLVWQEVVENGPASLVAMIFDPPSATWSVDRQLTTDTETLHHDLDGYYGSDGTLHGAYLATQVTRTTREVVIDGEPHTFTQIPVEGRTDLRLLDHSLIVDLAIDDVDLQVAPARPATGDNVDVWATIHNAGDFPVGSFDVAVVVRAPSGAETTVATTTVSGPLAGGASAQLELSFVFPAAGGDVLVELDRGAQIAEFLETNNTATWVLSNTPPDAVVVASPLTGEAPLEVSLDSSLTTDADSDSISFAWAFGDGSPGAEGEVVTHQFLHGGRFTVTLAARDSHGAIGAASVEIVISERLFADSFESGGVGNWSSAIP